MAMEFGVGVHGRFVDDFKLAVANWRLRQLHRSNTGGHKAISWFQVAKRASRRVGGGL